MVRVRGVKRRVYLLYRSLNDEILSDAVSCTQPQ